MNNTVLEQSAIASPILWVDNASTALHLYPNFQLFEYRQASKDIAPGQHYILVPKGTPEAVIKSIAWRIQAAGYECRVHGTNMLLQDLVTDKSTARELTILILTFALTYDDWVVINDENSLTVREAAQVASSAIALLPEPQKSIELSTLRERCKENSFVWDRLMGKLEDEFKRELERRQGCSNDDERLRLALLDLAQEKDLIKKTRKKAEICSHFRLSKAEVSELVKETSDRTQQQDLICLNFDQLFELKTQEENWLIPELLPQGETIILAGSPKTGKTLLAIDAAFAIATGETDFLGINLNRGKVLLISCDESLQSTKAKLVKRGFRKGDGQYLQIINNWTINQLYQLERKLEEFRPDVVIVDSLKRITINSEISENSAEFANNIYALKELFTQYGASGILIHHTNKNPEAMGVNKLRGSTAIAGAAWGTWQLEGIPKKDPENPKKLFIDPSDPTRILSIFARNVEGQLMKVEFDPENRSWQRLDKEVIAEQESLKNKILAVLKTNVGGLTGQGIMEVLGLSREQGGRSIYTTLDRMEAKRLVSCKQAVMNGRRVNLYTMLSVQSTLGDSLPPPPCVENVDPMLESTFDNELQLVSTLIIPESTLTIPESTPEKLTLGVDSAKPMLDNDSGLCQHLDDKEGGERGGTSIADSIPESQNQQNKKSVHLAIAPEQSTYKVGDRVTHADPNHVRAAHQGTVEAIQDGEFQICWDEDEDNQRPPALQTYSARELKFCQ